LSDPTTSNIALTVPLRGNDPGTWDVPVNNNSLEIDGFLGGVATVTLSNANVTLSAPTGTITPSAGPFQSTNRILKMSGALTGNVQVTLPLPGEYTIQNLTTGNFVVTFAAASAGNVVSTPSGSIMHVWNDGSNVWMVKPQIPGALTFLGGITAVPAWISACTIAPFLLCDGSIYNFSTYPALGNLYLGNFGGNGATTFGVQDLRGRVPLAYDGTGTRITTAGSGINGQTMGAAGGNQTINNGGGILRTDLPNVNMTLTGTPGTVNVASNNGAYLESGSPIGVATGGGGGAIAGQSGNSAFQTITSSGTFTPSGSTNLNGNVAQTFSNVVQPAQVSGIWLVST
jgi:microcystin-dependent protein